MQVESDTGNSFGSYLHGFQLVLRTYLSERMPSDHFIWSLETGWTNNRAPDNRRAF